MALKEDGHKFHKLAQSKNNWYAKFQVNFPNGRSLEFLYIPTYNFPFISSEDDRKFNKLQALISTN